MHCGGTKHHHSTKLGGLAPPGGSSEQMGAPAARWYGQAKGVTFVDIDSLSDLRLPIGAQGGPLAASLVSWMFLCSVSPQPDYQKVAHTEMGEGG